MGVPPPPARIVRQAPRRSKGNASQPQSIGGARPHGSPGIPVADHRGPTQTRCHLPPEAMNSCCPDHSGLGCDSGDVPLAWFRWVDIDLGHHHIQQNLRLQEIADLASSCWIPCPARVEDQIGHAAVCASPCIARSAVASVRASPGTCCSRWHRPDQQRASPRPTAPCPQSQENEDDWRPLRRPAPCGPARYHAGLSGALALWSLREAVLIPGEKGLGPSSVLGAAPQNWR